MEQALRRVLLRRECNVRAPRGTSSIGRSQMLRHALHLVFTLSLANVFSPSVWAESTLDKVKREGVIKICTPQVVPDLYKDPKTGEWLGVMADLANTLAAWM